MAKGTGARTNSQPRAAIYCRISRDAEQDGLGVERQRKDCATLARREGFRVVEVYTDNDISASTKSRKPRPKYDQMLEDVRARKIDVILAYSNSRLTRRPAEWIELITLANEGRLRIKTVASGEHDLGTADGRAVALTIAAWDAAEAERTAERGARKHREMAEQGRHNGPRPFGWNVEGKGADQKLVINKAEAAVVRECVRRVIAGEAIWAICKDLRARDVKTPRGAHWQTQPLRRMMMRWRNCGMRSHQPMLPDGSRSPEAVLSKGQWPKIYSRKQHEQLLEVLNHESRQVNRRGRDPIYLLSGVALCGACQGKLVGTKEFTYDIKGYRRKGATEAPIKKRTYPSAYKCAHMGCMRVQRRRADIDHHVTEVIVGVLERDGVSLMGGNPEVVEEASARIEEYRRALARAGSKWAKGEWSEETVDMVTADLRPKIEAETARLHAALPASELREFVGAQARQAWEKADVTRQKAIIKAIGMRITILPIGSGNGAKGYDPDAVKIEWVKPY